jgi:hypothetical protein
MLAASIYRPAGAQHQPHGIRVVPLRRVGKAAALVDNRDAKPLDRVLLAHLARHRQLELGRTAIHQQAIDVLVPELPREHVRRLIGSESPDVNGSTRARILHREVLLRHTHAHRRGVRLEMSRHQIHLAERRREQQIRPAAAPDQIPRDILPVPRHVLRRSGFVIDVAGVGIGAPIDQKSRDLDRRREMQWRLPIAAAHVDRFRIGFHQFAKPLEHSQASRCMSVDGRAAPDQKLRKFPVGAVEDAETAGPPVTPRVDIGPAAQERIHHLAIASADGEQKRSSAEMERRIALIQMRANIGILLEDRGDLGSIVGSNRGEQSLDCVFHA